MNRKNLTNKQNFSTIIITLPFLCAIILLIISIFTLDDIFLEKKFSINFITIATLSFIHLSSILILKNFNKIEIDIPKPLIKKIFSIFGYVLLLFLSNLLLEMGLRMNLNNWLKNDNIESIDLIVVDKYISRGKATDYYVIFNSSKGELRNKVKRKKFESFSIGEKYQANVKEGYFDGYFLTEPMNRIKNVPPLVH